MSLQLAPRKRDDARWGAGTEEKAQATTQRANSTPTNPLITKAIRAVMKQQPELSSYGFEFFQNPPYNWNCGEAFERCRAEMLTPGFAHMVETCIDAMNTQMPRGYALKVYACGSYDLKHAVEGWVRRGNLEGRARYIQNGAFIVAAIIMGWQPVRRWNCPNCTFRKGTA